jgi:hypothetical protein
MSTILEMAQAVRDAEATVRANRVHLLQSDSPKRIDLHDSDQVIHWCRTFGTTRLQLCSAIGKVGNDVAIVQRQLRSR